MRFSLKSFLFLLTLFAIFVGWRCNQRRSISAAARAVERMDGTLCYRWQKPTVVAATSAVTPAYVREQLYTVTLPDGSTETRTRELGHTQWHPIEVEFATLNETVPPARHISGFIFGTHDDIAVDVAGVKPADVDEAMIHALQKLDGLKTVLLRINRQYYRVSVAGWAPHEWREKELAELSKPINRATSLLESKLPNVAVARSMH